MKRTALLAMVWVLASAGAAAAESASPERAWKDPDRLSYGEIRFTPPRPERIVLDNGLTLYYLEDRELPVVNVTAVVGAGSIHDPEGKEGLAEITGDAMRTGGAGTLAGDQVDEQLETLAAPITVSLGMDYGTASLFALKKDWERAFAIFAAVLRTPRFEASKVQQEKNLKIEELRRVFDRPQRLAFREFRRAVYAGNARGRISDIPSVERIGRDDLVSFHRAHFFPRNLRIAVTGDLSRQEALDLLTKHFGDWDEEGPFESVSVPAPPARPPLFHFERKIPQSTVIIGTIGPGKEAPDFYPFTVLDHLLGSGGFRSRIFQEIRSNRGLAYSAGSFYDGRQGYGVFGAYALTKSETTGQVLTLLGDILKEARESRFSGQDIHLAKRAIVNSYIFSFTSRHGIAVQHMILEFQGLPTQFLVQYPARIDAVSRADVEKAAARYLEPGRCVVFVLGDESKFDQSLKAFGTVRRVK